MKVTIERKEKVEVEVQLPLFTKDKHHYYMLNENKSIVLFVGEDDYSISVNNYLMQFQVLVNLHLLLVMSLMPLLT